MTTDVTAQVAQAQTLRNLHTGGLLVLPNVWDAASARAVVEAGFPVVATASAAVTAMLGFPDGEQAPWQEMFAAAGRIASAVDVPVTVDAEAGYGMRPRELVDRLLEIGAVGCNLEDSDHRGGGLADASAQSRWLAAVRGAADDAGVPLVVNARVDTFLPSSGVAEADRVAEAVRRGRMYTDAGADCIYPIGMRERDDVAAVVAGLARPVNGNTGARLTLEDLESLGVARVSFGPTFYRQALAGFATSIAALRRP